MMGEKKRTSALTGLMSVLAVILGALAVLAIVLCAYMGLGSLLTGSKTSAVSQQEVLDAQSASTTEGGSLYSMEISSSLTVQNPQATLGDQDTDPNATDAAASGDDYILPDSSSRYLTEADVSGLSKADLRLARNEIYARHGYIFDSDDLKAYFEAKSWYKGTVPKASFSESVLSEVEKANIDLIKSYE